MNDRSPELLAIERKLDWPSLPRRLVARPRLVEKLDRNRHRRLTLMSAPAGYGKTTLALQWLASGSLRAAWVTLDAADRNPLRFLKIMVAALSRNPESEFPQTNSLLESSISPPWQPVLEVFLGEFIANRERIVLVLEDYHFVDDPEVHDLLEHLLEAAPASLCLVVLTRVDPPWPLARWRVRGWLSEIRARDLCLTVAETSELFHDIWGLTLDGASLEILQRRTEGWIAGLRLAQVTLSEASDPNRKARELSGSDAHIADFLVEEALEHLPPAIREFLATSVLMNRFNVPLMEHVLADTMQPEAVREIIAELEHKNLFLVSLDDRREWFRWHHLFRDLLLVYLAEDIRPARRTEILREAGAWFAKERLVEEAIGYDLAAGELDRAAELLGENLHAACQQDPSRRLVARWVDLFPKAARSEKLPLIVAEAYLHTIRFDVDGLEKLLRQAQRLRTSSPHEQRFRVDLESLWSYLCFWQGDVSKCLEHALAAKSMDPYTGSPPWSLCSMYHPGALALLGKPGDAFRHIDAAIAEAGPDNPSVAEILFAAAVLHLYALNLGTSRELVEQLLDLSQRVPIDSCWTGYAHHLTGIIAYEQNRLDDAQACFERLEKFRHIVPTRLYHDALLGQALVATARNDNERARACCSQARAYATEACDPTSLRISRSFELRLDVLRANRSSVFDDPPRNNDHQYFWLEVPTVTWTKHIIAHTDAEHRAAALSYVDDAVSRMRKFHNERQVFALEVLRSVVIDDLGERESALEALAGLVRRGAAQGLVRSFVDAGPRLKPLLDALSERTPGDRYLESLRAAFGDTEAAPREIAEFEASLTHRELETLRLLAWRMTNKEIAAELSVSPAAVKKRLENIFVKLDAHDRRAAVRKAIERGLISRSRI